MINWLRRKKEKLPTDFEISSMPKWVFDKETLRFLEVNSAAVALYGFSRKEFLHMNLLHIWPTFELIRLQEHITEKAFYGSNAGVWKHRNKNGDIMLVTVYGEDIWCRGKIQRLITIKNIGPELVRFIGENKFS